MHGEYVDVSGFRWTAEARPVHPGPPIMIGGGAPKILGLAGRLADIVSLNFNNASGRLGSPSVMSSGAAETRGQDLVDPRRCGRPVRSDRDRDRRLLRRPSATAPTAQLDAMAARVRRRRRRVRLAPARLLRLGRAGLRTAARATRALRGQLRHRRPTPPRRVRPRRRRPGRHADNRHRPPKMSRSARLAG